MADKIISDLETLPSINGDEVVPVENAAGTFGTSINDIKDFAVSGLALSPIGSVISFASSSAPAGYLECDGSSISRTTYADLFAVISTTWGVGDGSTTFNIPDLRGEFIRGFDNGRGIDVGRSFASSQGDAFQGHYHNMQANNSSGSAGNGGSYTTQAITNTRTNLITAPITDGTNGTPRTAAETRPRNFAILYCIKY